MADSNNCNPGKPGNPEIRRHSFKLKKGFNYPRNKVIGLQVEEAIYRLIRQANKDLLRKAIIESLISQGFEVPEDIAQPYRDMESQPILE
jgi:hypothetical protein